MASDPVSRRDFPEQLPQLDRLPAKLLPEFSNFEVRLFVLGQLLLFDDDLTHERAWDKPESLSAMENLCQYPHVPLEKLG